MKHNKFVIALEGIDGTGKSTQCHKLYEVLSDEGIKCRQLTFSLEHLNRDMMQTIKGYYEEKDESGYQKFEYAAVVYEQAKTYFEALISNDEHEIIIADRYIYSLMLLLKMSYPKAKFTSTLYEVLVNWLPAPDLLFYLNIDAETAWKRIGLRGEKPRKMETFESVTKSLDVFPSIIETASCETLNVDASSSADDIHNFIVGTTKNVIAEYISRKRLI